MKNLETLKLKMSENKKDGMIIFNSVNILYLTGLPGSSALLVTKDKEDSIFSYNVNFEYIKRNAFDFEVEKIKSSDNIYNKILKKAKTKKIENLVIDTVPIETWNKLSKIAEKKIKLELDKGLIQDLRKIKSRKEIQKLRKAAELTVRGMKVAAETISSGIRETEVRAEIEYAIKKHDYSGMAFETIVASGLGSAFPHGGFSNKKISKGDLVVVDVGAKYNFYCSDMTRTFVVGKPSTKQKKLLKIIKQSQEKALKIIKEGIKANYVDDVARKVIERAGYGEYFVHNVGHGVGLEVHEQPILGSKSKCTLSDGNVVTVEPGIYLVDYGGVRIEDTVLVKREGVEKLTDGIYHFELK